MLQGVAACCSVLQCVCVLWFVALCCVSYNVYPSAYCCLRVLRIGPAYCSVLQCVAVCCSVLRCVAVCCSMLQCVAEYVDAFVSFASALQQCVAVCCSVLQHVVVRCNVLQCAMQYVTVLCVVLR